MPCLAHTEHGEGFLGGVKQLITGARIRAEVCSKNHLKVLSRALCGVPQHSEGEFFPGELVLSCGWCWPLPVPDWSSWSYSSEAAKAYHQLSLETKKKSDIPKYSYYMRKIHYPSNIIGFV